MDFAFSSEQDDLRRAVRAVATDQYPPARLREVAEEHDAYDGDLWRLLAVDMGLAGVAVGEEYGGTGGSFVDAAVVLEEAGGALLPVPLLAAIVATEAIRRGEWSVASRVLPELAAGDRRAALAVASGVSGSGLTGTGDSLTGSVDHVLDGQHADLLVLAEPDGLWLATASDPGVTVTARPTLDLTRWQATVQLDHARAERIGDSAASAAAVDLLRIGLAIEAVGVARRCLTSTVDYLKTRVQFGRPIGSFQALQHRVADLVVRLESAASTAYYAAWVAADAPEELSVVAPLAKSVCADTAYAIAADTIQLHGGMGFTWEHDAHLYFKRATVTRLLLGDSQVQRRLVAERAGILG